MFNTVVTWQTMQDLTNKENFLLTKIKNKYNHKYSWEHLVRTMLFQGHRTCRYLFIFITILICHSGREGFYSGMMKKPGGIHCLCRRSSRTKVGVWFLGSVQAEFTIFDVVGFIWKDSWGEHNWKKKGGMRSNTVQQRMIVTSGRTSHRQGQTEFK